MLRSMTGFGTGRAADERRSFAVEIRSVNHKFCEVRAHVPREIGALEGLGIEAIDSALSGLTTMREREGAALEIELGRLLDEVRGSVAAIAEELPAAADHRKARLDQRLKEIIAAQPFDPLRLAQEAA